MVTAGSGLWGWLILVTLGSGVAIIWPIWLPYWSGASLCILVFAAIDLQRLETLKPPVVTRKLTGTLPVNRAQEVVLRFINTGLRPLHFDIHDHCPQGLGSAILPQRQGLMAGAEMTLSYTIAPEHMGVFSFGDTRVKLYSPWRIWRRIVTIETARTVRVMPDLGALPTMRSAYIEPEPDRAFGRRRRYTLGDPARHIDWKTSAYADRCMIREPRAPDPVVLFFWIDCLPSMALLDEHNSLLEQMCHSVTQVAWAALKRGDAVGMMGMSTTWRIIAPRRGPAAMSGIIDGLLALTTHGDTADFTSGARSLAEHLGKRVFIIWLTDPATRDAKDCQAGLAMLKQRHGLLVAGIQAATVSAARDQVITDLASALKYTAICEHLLTRQRFFNAIATTGIATLDVYSEDLADELNASILEFKRYDMLTQRLPC